MNLTMLLDKKIQDRAAYLRPHYGIHSLSSLATFNNSVCLPDVTIGVLSNFINNEEIYYQVA